MAVAIHVCGCTRQPRGEFIAALDQLLTYRRVELELLAFPTVGVKNWIRPVANLLRNGSELRVWFSQTIRDNDGSKVDVLQVWILRKRKLPVCFKDDFSDIRS